MQEGGRRLARSKRPQWLLVSAIALLLFLPVWILIIVPFLERIPADFYYRANVASHDNFYDVASGAFLGPQESETTFSYQATAKQGRILTIKNSFDVQTPAGDPIFSVTRSYGVNDRTGKHVDGFGDRQRDGYLFAPRHLKKGDSFTYWHINYDAPADMTYAGEETLYGLKVYRFETHYAGVHIDQTENLGYLPEVQQGLGVEVEPYLQLWIEPTTGYLVKYQDQTATFFYHQDTGKRVAPWNAFGNTYTDTSVAQHVGIAALKKQQATVLELYVSFMIVLLVGLLLLLHVVWIPLHQEESPSERSGLLASPYALPVLVLLVGSGVMLQMSWFLSNTIDQRTYTGFYTSTRDIHDAITDRLRADTNLLRGGKALFNASETVGRVEWKAYVDTMDVHRNFAGVQGVGFAKVFPTSEREAVTETVRAEGFPDFTVWPETTDDTSSSIVFLEPLDARNVRAFGYDMMTEAVRRKAMLYARDTGLLSLFQDA